MSKYWMALALVPLAIGCAALSKPASFSLQAARCEIRMSNVPEGVRIEAVAHGAPGATGNYQIAFEKKGSSGISQTSQGGDFVLDGSGNAVVSTTDVNIARGDRARAQMAISGASGTSDCEKIFSRG